MPWGWAWRRWCVRAPRTRGSSAGAPRSTSSSRTSPRSICSPAAPSSAPWWSRAPPSRRSARPGSRSGPRSRAIGRGSSSMPEIALFGGSFDPPHVGHLLAAAYVLATEPVDELWFVPVLQHPLDKPLVAPYEHRVALLERLAADLPRARVSRTEQESGEGRTVDLLEWLHRKHPDTRWALVLGTDLDAERPQWKRFERIQQLARIITVGRGGYAQAAVTLPEISSTQARALLKSGGDASRLVQRRVLEAIRAAGTYR